VPLENVDRHTEDFFVAIYFAVYIWFLILICVSFK